MALFEENVVTASRLSHKKILNMQVCFEMLNSNYDRQSKNNRLLTLIWNFAMCIYALTYLTRQWICSQKRGKTKSIVLLTAGTDLKEINKCHNHRTKLI